MQLTKISYPYTELDSLHTLPNIFKIQDHLDGYDKNLKNLCFEKLKHSTYTIVVHEVIQNEVKKNYPNLTFVFDANYQDCLNLRHFENYNIHPEVDYQNFVCSFNGTNHVGRQLLVSALNKFGYFNNDYCSKNFKNDGNVIDGNIYSHAKKSKFYNKFFDRTDEFNQLINSFGHVAFQHDKNIYNLENKLTQSFLNIVSESIAESYHPFVSEKFLYSIVTRGLFLAYAQPGWHAHIAKYYGFKLYTNLFDYRFDSITNPVERLVELMTMISKFSKLTTDEWHDLYLIEQDNIEFNYAHYFSKDYLKELKKYEN